VFWGIVGEECRTSLREATTYEDKDTASGNARRRKIPKVAAFDELCHEGKCDEDPFDWRLYVKDAIRRLPETLQEVAAVYMYEDLTIAQFTALKGWSRRDWMGARNEMLVQLAAAIRTIAQEQSQRKKKKRERSGDGSEADDTGDVL
jgi:hypothetical protein